MTKDWDNPSPIYGATHEWSRAEARAKPMQVEDAFELPPIVEIEYVEDKSRPWFGDPTGRFTSGEFGGRTVITTASSIATKAAELVGGDRHRTHGDKAENFKKIADVWQAYLNIRRYPQGPLNASDVGHMMALMKVARTQLGDFNPDDYIDGAGYLACAGEVAANANAPFERQLEG